MKNKLYAWNGSDFKEGVIKVLRGEECKKHMKRLDHLSRTHFEKPIISVTVFNNAEINAEDKAIAEWFSVMLK